MAVKVEVSNQNSEEGIEYPCIMTSKDGGLLVLFTKEKQGTVLIADEHHYLGEFIANWGMIYFTPLEGTVTLSNKH